MSKSSDANTSTSTNQPRALIHKKILDAAAEQPGASIERLAEEITAASPDLVERVLDQYGDPAETDEVPLDQDAGEQEPILEGQQNLDDEQSETSSAEQLNIELSDRQRETLSVVAANPTATQSEIAEELGVTAATVSNRLNDIEGFDWANRVEFLETTDQFEFLETSNEAAEPSTQMSTNNSVTEDASSLESRIDTIEEKLEGRDIQPTSVIDDPELVAKVIHACVKDERISEKEEVAIIRALVT